MGRWLTTVCAGLLLLLWAGPLAAQTRTRNHTARHTVQARSKLILSVGSMSFPSADPDAVPLVPADGAPITVTVRTTVVRGGLVTLTVVASDNLRSGLDSIDVSALQWTGAGTGFAVSGTMSRTAAQAVGNWTGSGERSGQQAYVFVNSWSHPTGSYTATLTYTLTTP